MVCTLCSSILAPTKQTPYKKPNSRHFLERFPVLHPQQLLLLMLSGAHPSLHQVESYGWGGDSSPTYLLGTPFWQWEEHKEKQGREEEMWEEKKIS